jgi:hypothetical protein
MTAGIVEKIRSAVEKVAGDKALTLVMDSASGILIYARLVAADSHPIRRRTQRRPHNGSRPSVRHPI